jgi:SPP1 gp7 family putative phage head morphogenesis protein
MMQYALLVTQWARDYERAVSSALGVHLDGVDDIPRKVGKANAKLARGLVRVGKSVEKHTEQEAVRLGVKIGNVASAEMVAAWRTENLSLITKLTEDGVRQLREVLTSNEGAHPKELTELIQERCGVVKSHAQLIGRDQVTKLNAQISQSRMQRAGIEEYIWTTSNDERVRDSHADLDGKRFRFDDPPDVDGEPCHPGEPIQCRCTAYPVDPLFDDIFNTPEDEE